MAQHKDVAIEGTAYFHFAANDTSGTGGDGATPLCDVRLCGAAADAAPVLSPTPELLSEASYPAGCYEVAIPAADPAFAAGSEYAIFCALTVDSQDPSGFVGTLRVTAAADTLHDGAARVMDVTDAAAVKTVTGAVGSVTGAVGSVAGNVDGNVTGDVGGNVDGSVGSVTGAVGSVAGNVDGNVTGDVGGNVDGSVASVGSTVDANLVQILGTALTETAGYIAAGFKKLFNIATPALTVASVNQTGDAYAAVGGLNDLSSGDVTAAVPTAAAIADAVLDEDRTGHEAADSLGEAVKELHALAAYGYVTDAGNKTVQVYDGADPATANLLFTLTAAVDGNEVTWVRS